MPLHTSASSRASIAAATCMLGIAAFTSVAAAQSAKPAVGTTAIAPIAALPAVKQALAALERDNAWTINQQISLCEIPAPPFKEAARAAEFRNRLRALGVQNVRIDKEGNVIGEL